MQDFPEGESCPGDLPMNPAQWLVRTAAAGATGAGLVQRREA